MTRRLRRPARSGVTLLEVLTAIFITAIGLLALLTLFPIGAMSMAQAIKDDRSGQLASQADGLFRAQWQASVLEALRQPNGIPTEMAFAAMEDPNLVERQRHPFPPLPSLTPPGTPGWHRLRFLSDLPLSNTNDPYFLPSPTTIPLAGSPPGPISPTSLVIDQNAGPVSTNPPSNTYDVIPGPRAAVPSFPVLIDPIGYYGRLATNAERYWVGRSAPNLPPFPSPYGSLLLPRRDMLGLKSTPNPQQSSLAVFSLTDDISFTSNGAPGLFNGSPQLRRQGKYTWAALVQRPRNDDLATASFKILVFEQRATLPPAGDEVMATQNGVNVNDRSILVTVPPRGGDEPSVIRKGGWVLDATIQNGPAGLLDPISIRNAHFYRIVGVTEVSAGTTGTTYALDIDPPIRTPTVAPGATPPTTYNAQFYFFANLAEVFERPMLRPDAENTGTN